MQLGMVGLGRMGANMTTRLSRAATRSSSTTATPRPSRRPPRVGRPAAASLEDLVSRLTRAARGLGDGALRCGHRGDDASAGRAASSRGDTVIDGGNSNYKDGMRRAADLAKRGVQFVDAGTSGGVWGLKEGYSLMIGGDAATVDRLRPIFETLAPAPDAGWAHVGPSGAGHFVKMIHNGIEYGLMQAYAEGFSILRHKEEFALDLPRHRRGLASRQRRAVVAARPRPPIALRDNPRLDGIAPFVVDSGEGRWTVAEAIDLECARAGHHAVAHRAAAVARRRLLRRQTAGRAPQPVRRSRHQGGANVCRPDPMTVPNAAPPPPSPSAAPPGANSDHQDAADPAIFVIFGATGDLAHRKILPALYQLHAPRLDRSGVPDRRRVPRRLDG